MVVRGEWILINSRVRKVRWCDSLTEGRSVSAQTLLQIPRPKVTTSIKNLIAHTHRDFPLSLYHIKAMSQDADVGLDQFAPTSNG